MESIDKSTSEIIDEIFIALQAIFPALKHSWPTQSEIDEAKYHWTKAFIESDLKDFERIKYGIIKCRESKSAFVPSAGQFIDMCRKVKEEAELPSVHQAFKEASRQYTDDIWSHVVVYNTYLEIGSFKLRHDAAKEVFPLFKTTYEMICDKYLMGGPLKDLPKLLKKPDEIIIKTELVAKNALDEIRKALRKK